MRRETEMTLTFSGMIYQFKEIVVVHDSAQQSTFVCNSDNHV
jgi:hypothetical protein